MSNREVRLEQMVDGLRREVRRLERENGDLRNRVGVVEHRIRNELEPRIKADDTTLGRSHRKEVTNADEN